MTEDEFRKGTPAPAVDMVHHPKHYNMHPAGIECITVIEEFPFNVGTAMKYLWRCNHKHADPVQDLEKAIEYIQFEIARVKRRPRTASATDGEEK